MRLNSSMLGSSRFNKKGQPLFKMSENQFGRTDEIRTASVLGSQTNNERLGQWTN
jgi:hypothetical protein